MASSALSVVTTVRAYTRVSSRDQALEGFGLEAQRSRIQARCKLEGWPDPVFYTVAGLSGTLDSRPELDRVLADLRMGDVLVATEITRLSRGGMLKAFGVLERIRSSGARLVTLQDGFDSSLPMSNLIYTVFSELGKDELERTRTRSMAGRVEAAKAGRFPVGTTPYGFTLEDGRLAPHAVFADHVRTIFGLAPGRSLARIVDALIDRGVPSPPRAKRWLQSTVSHMIRNRVYMGEFVYNRFSYPNDPEKWVSIPCPALVTPDVWDAAQSRRRNDHPRANPGTWPLSKSLRCAVCNGPMVGNADGRERWRKTYVCAVSMGSRSYREAGRSCTHKKKHLTRDVDARAAFALSEVLSSPEALTVIAMPPSDAERALSLEREKLEAQDRRMIEAVRDGTLTNAEVKDARNKIRDRLRDLERTVKPTVIPEAVRPRLERVKHLRGLELHELVRELSTRLILETDGQVRVLEVRIPDGWCS